MVDRLQNSEVNSRRIANVEACFGSSGQPLNVFGRVLVGEGVLMKMCRKKLKARQFFLFNDILIYGNILISKKRYNKQHIIPLEDVQLDDLTDEGELRNGWLIKTPRKSFAVYAATPVEKKEWMTHIERCVTDLLAKGNKKAATHHAAVWVPDAEASRCMLCGHTQFSLINRRHHCRSCGAVVCSSCSSHTFRILSQSKSPVRVCDNCFKRLTEQAKIVSEPKKEERRSEISQAGSDSSGEESDDGANLESSGPTFYREESS